MPDEPRTSLLDTQIPRGPVPVPADIQGLARGERIEPVWRNQLGGLTFRIGAGGPNERFAKWVSAGTPELDLAGEAARMRWVRGLSPADSGDVARARRLRVPEVLEQGTSDAGSWLVTRAVAGASAIAPENLARPVIAARAIGEGLRLLHDGLPAAECPFSWSIEQRMAAVHVRLEAGGGPADWSPDFQSLTAATALAELAEIPEPERLVVCHGDPCAPNTLLDPGGQYAAHVDLDALGVADPIADLAIAAWSTVWNYGPGYEDDVYAGYGMRPDPGLIRAYRLLWDLS